MTFNIRNRILHKLASVAPGDGSLRPWLHRRRGVTIGRNVWISQYVYIDELHPEALTIGDNCSIGLRTSIFTHFYWGPRRIDNGFGKVIIEDDVFVGPHCVLLPNVRIGRGSVIKAGTVVSRNVPPKVFWGMPAPEALAIAEVPLTSEQEYRNFLRGLKPVRKKRPNPWTVRQGLQNRLHSPPRRQGREEGPKTFHHRGAEGTENNYFSFFGRCRKRKRIPSLRELNAYLYGAKGFS